MLGPFGFIVLAMLDDTATEHWDFHLHFVRKLNIYLRIAYELCALLVVWGLAYEVMVLKRNMIHV